MTKTQLVAALADEMGSDKKSAGAALDAVCNIITREVSGVALLPFLELEKSNAVRVPKEWFAPPLLESRS